ncbi:DUF2236 domain-containing protein [Kineosporia sp. J2-2]|uniref:DUF2236 domain-containing protein n=1 Tax=Kineosporia corallincola TaxID=2835133 RepID=A0ABS5TLL1_9ACTN|nr:oxygenase MpaB family protein [Kineosporia corallincola]MBT0771994.1 DUF2236 domain-containing protein [Kineosporia corallincola]
MADDSDRVRLLDRKYRELAMSTFAFETRLTHRLGYLRTFASPRIAGLLRHTGQMGAEPRRRAYDTGLFMRAIIDAGLESPTGQCGVARLNVMHRQWRITNDDYVWVLGTFAVVNIRMIRRAGWRPITRAEQQTVIDWHVELGTRMGITDIPTDFATFDAWFTAYEARMLRRTPAGDELLRLAIGVVASTIPRRLRRPALALVPVLIEEPARTALGFRRPGLPARFVIGLLLAVRSWRRRRSGPPGPWFALGEPNGEYPDGWTLDDLGPRRSYTTETGRGD